MTVVKRLCHSCKSPLEGNDECSKCGSGDIEIHIEETINILEEVKAKHKDDKTPGYVKKIVHRTKFAGESKNLARETLTIDRTSEEETIKEHIVEEFYDGEWHVEHKHKDSSPAKRRPPREL